MKKETRNRAAATEAYLTFYRSVTTVFNAMLTNGYKVFIY